MQRAAPAPSSSVSTTSRRDDPHLVGAFLLLPLALVLDLADGIVARGRRHSPFGADLDSLPDVVSFGVAPAVRR
jgi:CDP-diacylglycerol--serine O-phosphatidyltransferase